MLGPFNTIISTYAHANLNWTGGPLRHLFVSPVFHRWHHAVEPRDRNFAGTFPIWDILFGTFRMPESRLPDHYGQDDLTIPTEIAGQLVYPFRQ